jgi:hypothetical protein
MPHILFRSRINLNLTYMMKIKQTIGAAALLLIAFGCEDNRDVQQLKPVDASPIFMDLPVSANARQSKQASKYAVLKAEYLTTGESGQVGRTIYFRNVGSKQLADDFVPGTSLDGTNNISYYIDENRPSQDLSVSQTSSKSFC